MKVICICPVVSGRLLECCDVAFVVNSTDNMHSTANLPRNLPVKNF